MFFHYVMFYNILCIITDVINICKVNICRFRGGGGSYNRRERKKPPLTRGIGERSFATP